MAPSEPKDIHYKIRGAENGIFERYRSGRCDPFGAGIITVSRLKTYDPVGVAWLTTLGDTNMSPIGSLVLMCLIYNMWCESQQQEVQFCESPIIIWFLWSLRYTYEKRGAENGIFEK